MKAYYAAKIGIFIHKKFLHLRFLGKIHFCESYQSNFTAISEAPSDYFLGKMLFLTITSLWFS